MELLMSHLVELAITLLIIGANIAIGYLITLLKKHKLIKGLKANEEIVKIAVKAVQEAYVEASGREKFEIAKEWIIQSFKDNNINVSENQVDFLIDSIVKDMKKEFGEAWKEVNINHTK